jgi:hypothetical protein
VQTLMQTSINDHNAAVQIKAQTKGWLAGAPLQAEQADMAASTQALQQAEQLDQQLSSNHNAKPWNCGPYPCT